LAFPIAFFGFLSLRYVSPMGRYAVVALMLLVFIPLSVLTYTGVPDANQRVLRALNKDATLTGRTMMWVKADAWIERSPEIGYGFRAFWTSESADSMGILHSFNLTDGRVFQLHNTIEEMRVDTGWLGLLAFLSTVMIFLCYIIAFVFLYPSASSAFIATMYLIILAHSPIEVLIGVFYPTTAFFYVCGTVAIVFFMNRHQIARDRARTATRGDGPFAWQGRIGQPALAPNHFQSI
jgi:exopolysaccharide production protein ExoQ